MCPLAACLTSGSSSLSFRMSHSLHCSGCYTHRHAHPLAQHSCRHVHLGHIFKHAWEEAPPTAGSRNYSLMLKRQEPLIIDSLQFAPQYISCLLCSTPDPSLVRSSFSCIFHFTQKNLYLNLSTETHTIPFSLILYLHYSFLSKIGFLYLFKH